MLNHRQKIGLAIAGTIWAALFCFWFADSLDVWENKSLDWRFQQRGPIAPNPQIAIVEIDEKSIQKLGRWPWNRDVHARLIKLLEKAQAKKIAFDVIFPESDLEHPEADKKFAEAVEKSNRVVLGSFFEMGDKDVPKNIFLPKFTLPPQRVGFTNNFSEKDGVTRRSYLNLTYQKRDWTSFALAVISTLERINFPKIEGNKFYLNYLGRYGTFPYSSYSEVLEGKISPQVFKDKIVLIGSTATGLYDRRSTPFTPDCPGVEVQATAVNNLLEKNWLRVFPGYLVLAVTFGFVLVFGLILPLLSAWRATFLALVLFFGYGFLSCLFFARGNYWLPMVFPLSLIFLSYVGIIFWRFLGEEKEKRYLRKALSSYLSHKVMEQVVAHPELLRLYGDRQDLSVMFTDIRGFTSISEKMTPEDVVALLNEYFSRMSEVVFHWDGTLNKFIGDAIMAFWGAPSGQTDHALRAVSCAREMIVELNKLQKKWLSENKPVLDIGIGINSGKMLIGNMGSTEKLDYTVIGDNVNVASRLEGLNKQYNTHILITEETYQRVKDAIPCRFVADSKVKGKEESLKIYEALGSGNKQ
ncbi:MAG: adenylate/guanylate cyclase domain-containing protein [Elusimicrobiota bacterium]